MTESAGRDGNLPGSGIHKSDDGGETWRELTEGLPGESMGKVGLAISPDVDFKKAAMPGNLVAVGPPTRDQGHEVLGEWPSRV